MFCQLCLGRGEFEAQYRIGPYYDTDDIIVIFLLHRKSLLAISLLGASLLSTVAAAGEAPAGTGGIMQAGPDAEKAVQADYDRLKARGTREGLELFIERHPDHALADKARAEIEKLYGAN